jgi:hypothetical protein
MNSATAAVTATADRKQSEGVRSYEEGRYEEALLSECSSPFDLFKLIGTSPNVPTPNMSCTAGGNGYS